MKELARSQFRSENKSCLAQWVNIGGGCGEGGLVREGERKGGGERWGGEEVVAEKAVEE